MCMQKKPSFSDFIKKKKLIWPKSGSRGLWGPKNQRGRTTKKTHPFLRFSYKLLITLENIYLSSYNKLYLTSRNIMHSGMSTAIYRKHNLYLVFSSTAIYINVCAVLLSVLHTMFPLYILIDFVISIFYFHMKKKHLFVSRIYFARIIAQWITFSFWGCIIYCETAVFET